MQWYSILLHSIIWILQLFRAEFCYFRDGGTGYIMIFMQGPNFSGTKLLGDQISCRPIMSGAQMRLGNISVIAHKISNHQPYFSLQSHGCCNDRPEKNVYAKSNYSTTKRLGKPHAQYFPDGFTSNVFPVTFLVLLKVNYVLSIYPKLFWTFPN